MLPAIALSSVLGVDVEWSSSYKGRTYGPSTVHIVRTRDEFVSNGAVVSESAVQALIGALQRPAMREPTPEALQIDGGALGSLEPASMQGCDGVSATQAAQDVYRQRFTDAAGFAQFLGSYYAKPPAPDAAIPSLRITVTTSGGQIIASSSSTKAGMLPFTIVRDGTTLTTYDASLPNAVAALLPTSPAAMMLQVSSMNREWAVNVCDEKMTDLAFHDALPETFEFAQAHGLELHGSVHGDPINGLTALIWKTDIPRITMSYNADVSGGDAASVMALRFCSNVLHRITVIPWLQHVLATNPSATVNVDDPSMKPSILDAAEVQELRNAGFGKAASLLAGNLATAQSFWVWLKPDKEATQWFLMPNGDALLVNYLPAETRLPFDPQMNALIHRRGKPFGRTPTITVGAVVSPAGALKP